jgi:hypothetical protein
LRFYQEWTRAVGLGANPLLEGYPVTTRNALLACYTLKLCTGSNLKSKTIKVSTVRRYLGAVTKYFKAQGQPDPLADASGHRSSRIDGILRECHRWESLTDKREPLTWEMVCYQQAKARAQHPDSLDAIMADWFLVGMYTGFRLSEWAQPASHIRQHKDFQRNIDGSSTAITSKDIIIKPSLLSVRYRFQKNGGNGEKIPYEACVTRPDRCPRLAILRIVDRARRFGIPEDAPLAQYKDASGLAFITDEIISHHLRQAAKAAHAISDPNELALWTSHSIRIGACVALRALNHDFVFIKQRLRWRSDSFMMYLRHTPQLAALHSELFSAT